MTLRLGVLGLLSLAGFLIGHTWPHETVRLPRAPHPAHDRATVDDRAANAPIDPRPNPAARLDATMHAPVRGTPPERNVHDTVISGHVTDENGRPFAGAVVEATPSNSPAFPKRRQFDSPSDWGAALAQLHGELRAMIRRGATDDDGYFEVRGFEGGQWLVVDHEDETDRFGSRRVYARPGAHVELRAVPLVEVDIRVFDPDGRPVPRGTIEVTQEPVLRPWTRGAWTTPYSWSTPRVAIPTTARFLRANYRDHEPIATAWQPVPEVSGTRIELRPAKPARLCITVSHRGEPRTVTVAIARADSNVDREAVLERARYDYDDPPLSFSAENPAKTLSKDLDPGTYAIGLLGPSNRWLAIREVDVEPGVQSVEIEIPPVPDADRLVVEAHGPDGPLRAIVLSGALPYNSRPQFLRSVEPGRFATSASRFFLDSESPTSLVLGVTSPGLGTRAVVATSDDERGWFAQCTFDQPAPLEVALTGTGPELRRRLTAELRVVPPGTPPGVLGPRVAWVTPMPTSGPLVLGYQPAGDYELTLYLYDPRSFPPTRWATLPLTWNGRPSEAPVVALPRLCWVQLECPSSLAGETVSITPDDSEQSLSFHEIPDSGLVSLGPVPAGRYSISVAGWSNDVEVTGDVRWPVSDTGAIGAGR